MKTILRLGRVDEEVSCSDAEKRKFLSRYHHPGGFAAREVRFRDDSRNLWREWQPTPGRQVRRLTRQLQAAGFMPHAVHDGIFGYVTQAGVRLFQEYVRSNDLPSESSPPGSPSCWPDGIVGENTYHHLSAWREGGRVCRWTDGPPTEDYVRWMSGLRKLAHHCRRAPTATLRRLIAADVRGDSLTPGEWDFNPQEPHLIGIRRGTARLAAAGRVPDDLFVLLINGLTFYFSGSTDARPAAGAEAYLVEGQHRYRFNWHNVGPRRRQRIYKAARPAGAGVMVVRDVHGHDALSPDNIRDGFDPRPNPTINIHWNGLGISNWSAGCQVISGSSYLDDTGTVVRCRAYTARNDAERGTRRAAGGPRLTMGAYSFLSDLLLCYTPAPPAPQEKPVFRYTLLSEEMLDHLPGLSVGELAAYRHRLQSVLT